MSTDFRNTKKRAWNKERKPKPKVEFNEASYFPLFNKDTYYSYMTEKGGTILNPVVEVEAAQVEEFDLIITINKVPNRIPCKEGENKLVSLVVEPETTIKIEVEDGVELNGVTIKYKLLSRYV